MALFLSTYLNKIDRKGRVSVPAAYRDTLKKGGHESVVVHGPYALPTIECLSPARMAQMSSSVDGEEAYSDRHSDLQLLLFPNAAELTWDSEGRIILPEELLTHAGITEQALFAGAGPTFHIWEPNAFKQRQAEARERAIRERLTLRLKDSNGNGSERKS